MSEIQSEEKQEISKQEMPELTEAERVKVRQVVAEVIQNKFSGPIPPPDIIQGYENILPGAADRILTMAEEQSKHRQALEKKMVSAESRDSLLGVLFAFVLGLGCIAAAIVIVISVPDNTGAISGSIIGISGIGSIIATFINSTRGEKNKTQPKNKKE